MGFKQFWNGFKKVVSSPFKLIANVGKKIYNGVIKPVANFGSNSIKSVGNFIKDSANVVLHMPEKVLHTVDHTVDKAGETLTGFFKSPMVLIAAIGGVMILPSLLKK
jgi:hypothetical protein